MQIKFLGATETVTGSKYLVRSGSATILVDCGLFQGFKLLRLRNWASLPIDPASIDAVILTHAHLDHSGYLPLLIKKGFRGKVFCTQATFDLCKILLPDSGYLQEEEANFANFRRFSKHDPALPLYTQADAEYALGFFEPIPFHAAFPVAGDLTATFLLAGHILGAAIVVLKDPKTTITFSGDLGRPEDLMMLPPEHVAKTDYLVIESTYGNRSHDPTDPAVLLGKVIRDTCRHGGVVVIPSFAVGRTQTLLYYMHLLKSSGEIPMHVPVFLNSPMARDVTEIYHEHLKEQRLTFSQCESMVHAATIINTVDESKALNERHGPMVIIAASGMASGGRVLHHLARFAPDSRNTILFAGFQAGGTRGAAMLEGADSIKIHGQYVPVRAKVAHIDNLSAHADREELVGWMSGFESPPKMTYITHGEPDAANGLKTRIQDQLKWQCHIPEYCESINLG